MTTKTKRVRVDLDPKCEDRDAVIVELRISARAVEIWQDYVRMHLGLGPQSLREFLAMGIRDAADWCWKQARRERWVWSNGRPLFRGRRVLPRIPVKQ